jgi:(S)-ureidoglycine aminohydrolase
MSYWVPRGGLPAQTELTTGQSGRAAFTEAYAVLPRGTMSDIVTSRLPHWDDTRLWVIARPLSGFAETFSWYVVEVAPGGGSERPDDDPDAEAVLFVVGGTVVLTIDGVVHRLGPGGYAFLPPDAGWALRNEGDEHATFHWIRKAYQRIEGMDEPDVLVTHERDVEPVEMPGTDGVWSTTKSTPSAPGSSSGLSLPPPGETSTMYCENVSEKPDSGRAITQSRVSSQNGSWLVTMSRIVPRGSTA